MKGPNGVDVPTNVVRQVCMVPEMYTAVSVQDSLLSGQSNHFISLLSAIIAIIAGRKTSCTLSDQNQCLGRVGLCPCLNV